MPRFTDEQQKAIDLEEGNILVSAGAGSGKTAVLSERVLRKIKNKVSIDNLLVLTFTNAAAAEMKIRIRDKVGKENDLKEEFEKIESSYITTFDAFTLSIVKKYHYLKNLDKNIGVCDSSIMSIKKNELIDKLFDKMYEEQDKEFLSLIKDYCFKSDDDLKNFVQKSQEAIDLLYDKNNYLDNYINNFYNEKKIKEYTNKYFSIIKKLIDNIKTTYENIILLNEEYSKKIDINDLINSSTYEDAYKNFNKNLPRVPNNSPELSEEKTKLKDMLEKLEKYLVYQSIEEFEKDYLSTEKNTKTIINIVKQYDESINDFKLKENLFEFLDIEKLAIDILKENDEVREYYKNRFNEILIDEYQDTSDLQEIFIEQISNNNVYMVGDIKQSIYRFRNANPDIFRNKFNDYGKNVGGRRIDLNKNFRSREEVLSNINLIFDFLMDDEIGGADYKKEHRLIFGNLAYNENGKVKHSNNFEVLSYEEDKNKEYSNDEIEIFMMARDIQEKIKSGYEIFDKDNSEKRSINYNDFAILINDSKNFDLIKKIFTSEKIPLIIYKDESIKESTNLKIIKNILILISKARKKNYDKEFKYAFTSVARSYLFSISDDEIFDILEDRKYFDTKIYEKIKKIIDNIENKNIYDIVSQVIEVFDFYNKIILIGSIKENYALLEYIENVSVSASLIYTLDEFINYFDNITNGDIDVKYSLSKKDALSVKLMTIHGSKGLEYPVVYFPSLSKQFNQKEVKTKFSFNKDLGFILPVVKENLEVCFTKNILKNEFKKEDISEKLRLFYVALTRAKEKFIFVMNFENKDNYEISGDTINNYDRLKYNSFKSILESVNKTIAPYSKKIDLEKLSMNKNYEQIKKSNYKEKIEKTDEVINAIDNKYDIVIEEEKHFSKSVKEIFTSEEKKFIKEGLLIHEIMESIDFKNPDLTLVEDKYKSIVNNFLHLDILKNTLNFYKEYEFIYKDESALMHGIIDLLIEKENKCVIIDYKLNNTTSDAYIKQLNGYKKYIEKVTNKKTEIYLYSLVQSKLVKL